MLLECGSGASKRVLGLSKEANHVVGIQDDAFHLKLVFMRLMRLDRNDTLPIVLN